MYRSAEGRTRRRIGCHQLGFERSRAKSEENQTMNMKMLAGALAIATLIAPVAFAQSNGNFSASGTAASCAIGAGGTFGTPGSPGGGTTLSSFTADISTGNGSGTTLDIRPSLVTGLFTDTK